MPTVTPGATLPAIPYRQPVPPPTGLGVARVSVSIDAAWLPYIIGCCKVLTANSTFDPPDPATALAAIKSAYNLLWDLSNPTPVVSTVPPGTDCGCGCEGYDCVQLQFNCGVLQIWDCVQGVWVDVPSVGNCAANPAPGAGAGQPGPGQTSPNICLTADASTLTPLPWAVTTGDVLDFTSILGAGNDGTPPLWYCPDGSIFYLGACVGGGAPSSGDPLNTTKHMALLLKIGSNYYPLVDGTFTVPSGVSAVVPYIQVNDPTIANCRGTYTICSTYKNNATTSWRAHIDFRTAAGGFATIPIFSGALGVWTPGSGWNGSSGFVSAGQWNHGVYIKLLFATPPNVTSVEVKGSKVDGTVASSSDLCFGVVDTAGSLAPSYTFGTMPSSPFDIAGTGGTGVDQITILLYDSFQISSSTPGTSLVTDLYLAGTGTIPPELAPYAY